MKKIELKNKRFIQRKNRVRAKISGTPTRPRLSVFRSIRHIYAQLIDDEAGKTLVAVSDKNLKGIEKMNKTNISFLVGEELAKKALAKKIKKAAFDKGAYKFHGRVKALAEGARKGGLEF